MFRGQAPPHQKTAALKLRGRADQDILTYLEVDLTEVNLKAKEIALEEKKNALEAE